jgi:predicted ATPase
MLDVTREYAASRLAAAGEADRWAGCHAAYFLALAEDVEPRLRAADQSVWHRRLAADLANLRLAFQWSVQVGDARYALRMAGALWMFFRWHGRFAEGRRWLREALQIAPDAHLTERAKALWGAGWLAYDRGDYADTAVLAGQLLDLSRRTGDPAHRRNALTLQGMTRMAAGRYEAAVTSFENALDSARKTDSGWLHATSLFNLALRSPTPGSRIEESTSSRTRSSGTALSATSCSRLVRRDILPCARCWAVTRPGRPACSNTAWCGRFAWVRAGASRRRWKACA